MQRYDGTRGVLEPQCCVKLCGYVTLWSGFFNMRDYVPQAHLLIGSTLRDARHDRQGRIVGVDQSRHAPAIFVVWSGQPQAERVALEMDQLRALVRAFLEVPERKKDSSASRGATPRHQMHTASELHYEPKKRVGVR
ncbi:hypothetical protein [Halomonas sp. WWR20]